MEYDFHKVIDRVGTNNFKWDARKAVFGREDIIPMWIADMDFATPPFVMNALENRLHHPILGYNIQPPSLFASVARWCRVRHQWSVSEQSIMTSPGVIPGFTIAIMALTEKDEGVIIQTPVYPPFSGAVKETNRRLVENKLINTDGYYTIDFDDFEEKVKDPNNKLFILCSPHNPVGRVWKREELVRMYELCAAHDVIVVADEVHHDLVFPGHEHSMYASLNEDAANHSVTLMSPCKTFNLAGMNTAFAIIPNPSIRKKVSTYFRTLHINRVNVLGAVAAETAYTEGDAWVDELVDTLYDNVRYIMDYLHEHLPLLRVVQPEGTYLLWIDFRAYFDTEKDLKQFLFHEAKVGFNMGGDYGTEGEGFARLNFAAPHPIIEQSMKQLNEAFKRLPLP